VSIEDDLRRAIEGSIHYHSAHEFVPPKKPGPYRTQFVVATGTSLQVAAELGGGGRGDDAGRRHIGILNSASGKSPDKFFRGTISQEECICRASLLYPCLRQYEDKPHHFYYINRKEKYMNNASACAIFAPLVPVIRNDSVRGELLDKPQLCSFVNIPSANAFVVGREEHEANIPKAQPPNSAARGIPHENMTLRDAMYDRIYRALCIFRENGCTELVLCSFGCGVHGNNPETVAKIFREILLESNMRNHFRTVVFAIQPSRTSNYMAFQTVFPEATAL